MSCGHGHKMNLRKRKFLAVALAANTLTIIAVAGCCLRLDQMMLSGLVVGVSGRLAIDNGLLYLLWKGRVGAGYALAGIWTATAVIGLAILPRVTAHSLVNAMIDVLVILIELLLVSTLVSLMRTEPD